MKKTYSPQDIEQKTYDYWEKNGYFHPSEQGEGYAIVIPPPNVTGSLHMGHGFQYAIMDCLIRYQRMLGKSVLWQVGSDHAGIATQMVVENQLKLEGKKRQDIGREAFVERAKEWRDQYGNSIMRQIRRLGASIDWHRERFTLDQNFNNSVKSVFIELYRQGLIYRGKRLVNWDPYFKTALSDLEVVSSEEQGHLWYIHYPVNNSNELLLIATTRPETMLGDTAVAVHPDDERYQHLIGKTVKLPLSQRDIPIIADDYVDREFGSGCVKITPAHDFNDYDMGKRHHLPMINILTDDGCINNNAPAAYQGLDRFDARKKIVADLKQLGLLEKIEPHTLSIPRNDRGKHIVEPYLTDQWYVNAKPLAQQAIAAVREGKTAFVPENWRKTYFQWLENIEDWCISRQLWWGHRIPAWYDQQGNVYVGRDELDVRQHYQLSDTLALRQDEDVLDTWFSAALWPFETLDWQRDPKLFEHFYPTAVLVTGFDIIFFWVARMMMMSLKFTGQVPFKEVYITGLIRDHEGQKMSKTKGNVIDPIDLIDGIDLESLVKKRTQGLMQVSKKESIEKATRKQFPQGIPSSGTDALRFTYLALASTGRDIRFDVNRLQGYRNFCNKLWNAARYVLMHAENKPLCKDISAYQLNVVDQWILSILQQTIEKSHHYFKQYRFDLLAQLLYDFTWHEYCDWYVELSKSLLNASDDAVLRQAQDTTLRQAQGTALRQAQDTTLEQAQGITLFILTTVLEQLLRLLHPLMPFITETIWQEIAPLLGKKGKTIMQQPYPQADSTLIEQSAEQEIAWLKQFITTIRNLRGEMTISPGKKLSVQLVKGSDRDKYYVEKNQQLLTELARLNSIEWQQQKLTTPSINSFIGDLELQIPMADLVNKTEEIKRLQKEIDKIDKDYQFLNKKLSNANFLAKAPASVVNKDKARLTELEKTRDKVRKQLEQMQR